MQDFCCRFAADKRRIVSGPNDRSAAVWDVSSGAKLHGSFLHDSVVEQAWIDENDSRIFIDGADKFRLSNVKNGKCVDKFSDCSMLSRDVRILVIRRAQVGK